MKYKILYIILVLTFIQCTDKEKTEYQEFYQMDVSEKTEKLYSPRKKAKIPFPHNQIYDPFKNKTTSKSGFEKGPFNQLIIEVLDTINSSINLADRKKTQELFSGIPVIIKNKSRKKTNTLYLHRGCALLIQEAKDKNGNWKPIERIASEKLGKFYYKINPTEYIYTKVPRYGGTFETTLRIKLMLDEDSFIYSNEYQGNVEPWRIR